MEPLYTTDGDRLVPSVHTRGPWDLGAQHAGAPAALLARAVEQAVPDGLRVARLTYDLHRPVTIAPCTVDVETTRPGRRVVGLRAELAVDGRVSMTVAAVALRRDDTADAAPPGAHGGPPFPPAEAGRPAAFAFGVEADEQFHRTAMDVRVVAGGVDRPGPAAAWFRLWRPLVDGEAPSPLQRLAAAADFANGLSWVTDPARWTFMNVDLTVHVDAEPAGEWVALDARTSIGPHGSGWTDGTLWDAGGRLGRCSQTVFVARRDGA